MNIYIIHRDVDFEFGENWGVFNSLKRAYEELKNILGTSEDQKEFPEEFSIEEWEIDGTLKYKYKILDFKPPYSLVKLIDFNQYKEIDL